MRRVEQASDDSGAAYAHFQRALMLEEQVRNRTRDLEQTLELLNRSNARLSLAMQEAEARPRRPLQRAGVGARGLRALQLRRPAGDVQQPLRPVAA